MIRETVRKFLMKPYTSQVQIMKEFGFEWDWAQDPIAQRAVFFKSLKADGRVDEFCNYILGESNG